MPWKACSAMEERLRFIARLLEGKAMIDVCRECGISRKTGYKILARYGDEGTTALSDRSRRPVRDANQLSSQIEGLVVSLKTGKPHWGARKIRELLIHRMPGDLRVPAQSTTHAVFDRHGLAARIGRRRNRAQGTPLSAGNKPEDLCCVDFKGEFRLGNTKYCYPFTVTDHALRNLLLCEQLPPSPPSSTCLPNAPCQTPSGPTTASRSPAQTPCSTCQSCPSGGCASASPSRASSLATRSRTGGMSACISH